MADWSAIWRNGERVDALDAGDRGLAYGDGLYETMRASGGALPWWPQHRARLGHGAERLGLALPADALFNEALAAATMQAPDGVVKLIMTRGAGARGYAPPADATPTLLVSASAALPPPLPALHVGLLDLRLGVQPTLAGLKHLNRLEQVLGASEAQRRGFDDGLMADAEGWLTCSTRANLFAFVGGRWITPPLERAGVAGVTRALLLRDWPALSVAPLAASDLSNVDALFLANAVRGILAVRQCDGRALDARRADLAAARTALAASHPGFREA